MMGFKAGTLYKKVWEEIHEIYSKRLQSRDIIAMIDNHLKSKNRNLSEKENERYSIVSEIRKKHDKEIEEATKEVDKEINIINQEIDKMLSNRQKSLKHMTEYSDKYDLIIKKYEKKFPDLKKIKPKLNPLANDKKYYVRSSV